MKLVELCGVTMADGVAISAWRLAQEFWSRGHALIPLEIFEMLEHADALVQCRLADVRERSVYVRGSSEYLSWVQEKRAQASEAGKKSAEARRAKSGNAQPRGGKGSKLTEREPNENRTEVNGTEPSGSGSISDSKKNSVTTSLVVPEKPPNPMGVYITAYQERYGIRPEVGPREGKILQRFAGNHPDRWADLIRGYLQMPDSWAVQRSHPVEVLVAKVNEVGRFLATGKVVTRKVIEHAEEIIDKAQGTDKKPRRSLDEIQRERDEMLSQSTAQTTIGGKT